MTDIIKEERDGAHMKTWKHTHRESNHKKMVAEVRVMLPEAQEHEKPSQCERGQEKFFPNVLRVSIALQTLPFLASSLQN